MRGDWRDTVLPSLALFGSTSTLVCCALPALLISLGAGAVMASSDLGDTGHHVALSAQRPVVYCRRSGLSDQLDDRVATT